MAYNPAAPAAPEPIAHREKTPPPEDGVEGSGLNAAARHDQGYTPGIQQQQQQRYQPQGGYQVGQGQPIQYGFGSSQAGQQNRSSQPSQHQAAAYAVPPPPPPSSMGGYTSPPPQASTTSSYATFNPRSPSTPATTAPSFGPSAASAILQRQQPPLGQIQGVSPEHQHSQAADQYTPHDHSAGTPAMTPGSQFYSTIPQPAKPLAHVQPQYADYLSAGSVPAQSAYSPAQSVSSPQPPIGGYSDYNYKTGSSQGQHSDNPYDVHHQVYRPTEAEAGGHGHGHKKPARSSTSDGRKQSTVERAENKVGKLFKKIEKKIG